MTDWPLDWRVVVDEAIRRRKAERLSQRGLAALAGVSVPTVNSFERGDIRLRFERIVAILKALDLVTGIGDSDSFQTFLRAARQRWDELTRALPHKHPSRQPLGHSEQAYAIDGIVAVPLGRLREILSAMPKTSGWTPFWVPTRPELRPAARGDVIECWLGRPDAERHFDDAAHSDFWHVSRDGHAYLQRGYQEDGPNNLEPGTIFDLTLPIWRTAELMLHAAHLARALGAGAATRIRFLGRYTGLEGRELTSWVKPLMRMALDERYRARSSKAELAVETTLGLIETSLEEVVANFTSPLYERFDGYQPPAPLIASQVRELRQSAGLLVGPMKGRSDGA